MVDQIKVGEDLVVSSVEPGAKISQVRNQDATITVTRTWPPEQRQEKIQIRPFVTEVAKISVAKGLTINAGNYNSIRVDVIVTLPCYLEEINETYQYAKQLAEKWIQSEEQFIQEELRKLNG